MNEQAREPIRIEMTDDAAQLHERVFPLIQHYAESPGDFEATSHAIIGAHVATCAECQRRMAACTVGGDE